jgi:hypothetical protein
MSAEKAEFRAAVIHEMGSRFDDVLEASNAAIFRAEGAEQALNQASTVIEQLQRYVDADVDAGTLDLEGSALVKGWITRAVCALRQLEQNAALTQTAQRGHAQGVALCVQLAKKQHAAELLNAETSRQREMREDGEFRSIKEERLSAPPDGSVNPPANGESVRPRRRVRKDSHGPNA